jgi:uncharacterized damage-inducible protein DinB
MTLAEPIRTYIEYHYALTRRVWESIQHLSDEQFVIEIPHSHGSIRNQMVHLATTDARWLHGMQGQPEARYITFDPADYPTRQSAQALWEGVAQEALHFVAGLDDAGMLHAPQGVGGPAWQVLLHVVNHGTDHRAQVLRALHDFGAPTFDQDFMMYLWTR